MGGPQGHPSESLPALCCLCTLSQVCRFPGHTALYQIKLLRVEGCNEGWIQSFQALARESNLLGSVTHVCDEKARSQASCAKAGMGSEGQREGLWQRNRVFDNQREWSQRVDFQGTRGMDEVKRFLNISYVPIYGQVSGYKVSGSSPSNGAPQGTAVLLQD